MVLVLLILFAGLSFVLITTLSLRRCRQEKLLDLRPWEGGRHEKDVEIFRVLLGRADWRYLRDSLPSREFDYFQRKRIRLALRLLQVVDRDTKHLVELGRRAQMSAHPAYRPQADQLVAAAIRFRLNLLRVRLWLYVQWLFPSRTFLLSSFEVRFEHLFGSLARFKEHHRQHFSYKPSTQ